MKTDTAKKIFGSSQHCISKLNEMLFSVQNELTDKEFKELRTSVSQAMGRLIDICEIHVYTEHPELKPYETD